LRALVLGGTGSIGSSVVSALVSRRHEVVALARSGSAAERLTAQGAQPLPDPPLEFPAWLADLRSHWAGAPTSAEG